MAPPKSFGDRDQSRIRNDRMHNQPSSKPFAYPRSLKRKRDEEDLEVLSQRVAQWDSGTSPETFDELPLSSPTLRGLDKSHFKQLTAIQAKSIPISLQGSDILGAAKTGSGKTLAFIVPVLENLLRKRWTEHDGVGALILSPTRELAIQIFEVLRKVGRNHTFSAGLLIGGKSLKEEQERLGRMNILVATPGRMLQHLDQTSDLDIGNLQMLVLDEADRIMDMGFRDTVDAIVEHLPSDRQTLMFSATQTKRVSDLARLSLKEPEFVSVDSGADSATPATLQQNYVVTPLPEKLDTLWSFIRANLKKKILVFLSSGKQVRFVYEAFRHLQPGIPLLHVHGRQKQTARLDITTKFSNSQHACLFATDVAARGLDFPAVDWVLQVDCPEDADTYIHRVGRTARYEHEGHAILFVDPSEEEGMLKALGRRKVVVEQIKVRQKKMQNTIRHQLQNMNFKDPELKYLGQKAFVSYVRSVHVQKDKDIFKVKELDLEEYAASLGLPGAPRVRFIKGEDAKSRKNAPRQLLAMSSGSEEDEPAEKEKPVVRTKYDRMFERRNQDVLAGHYSKMIDDGEDAASRSNVSGATVDADEDNDFLNVKRRFDAGDEALGKDEQPSVDGSEDNGDPAATSGKTTSNRLDPRSSDPRIKKVRLSTNPSDNPMIIDSKRKEKMLTSKKKLLKYKGTGTHLHFDDKDLPHEKVYYEKEAEFARKGKAEDLREAFLAGEREKAKVADAGDKELERRKRREKKEKRKARERAELEAEDGDRDNDEVGVQLAPYRSADDEATKVTRRHENDRQRQADVADEPQTLEDLEAMATSMLRQ